MAVRIIVQGLVVAAVVEAAVVVSEALAAGLIPVAAGLGDLLQGLESCYRAHNHRCKAWLLLLSSVQGLAKGLGSFCPCCGRLHGIVTGHCYWLKGSYQWLQVLVFAAVVIDDA